MREIWLRPNRRILTFAAVLPGAALAVGIVLIVVSQSGQHGRWLLALGVVVTGIAFIGLAFLFWQAAQPRLACDGRHLLVNLGTARSIAVPLELVEGFLLGHGPSFLPSKRYESAQVANFVVRLAERAPEWERVQVNRQLGSWCGHYITIRGTWCQPLNVALVNRLNARLAELKKALPREAA